jgi:hypothetical protein
MYMLPYEILCKQDEPLFARFSTQEINGLCSVGESRIGPVPSAHMSQGEVQIRHVVLPQRRPYLVHLLRFMLRRSVAPGSRWTKPNRFAWEPVQ